MSEENGWVYFIVAVTTGLVKIGYSKNPDTRLKALSQQAPVQYDLVATIPGTMKDEKEFHRKFSAKREHGEWFNYDEEMYQFVKAVREVHGHSPHNRRKRKVRDLPGPVIIEALE